MEREATSFVRICIQIDHGGLRLPDGTVAAYQGWAIRLFEMMAEDRDHQLADYQMFMEAGAHFPLNIWQCNSSAVSAQLQGAGAVPLASSAAF